MISWHIFLLWPGLFLNWKSDFGLKTNQAQSTFFYSDGQINKFLLTSIFFILLTRVYVTLTDGSTRGHPFKLHKFLASTRVRRFAFATHIVNDWNRLPSEVVCAPSLNAFKARLDTHWAHVRYSIPDTDWDMAGIMSSMRPGTTGLVA